MTCAFAVRGALKKLPGVDSVDVSLNKGLASVKLKPGNTLTMQQFWQAVKQNGFTPKESRVVVRGELNSNAGKLQLKATASSPAYELLSAPASPRMMDDLKRLNGKTVSLEATLTPAKDLSAAAPLYVQKILP